MWKDVVGFEGRMLINEVGEVYSLLTNKILKQVTRKNGYQTIMTRVGGREGKCYCLKVHRLVAEAFIPNPEHKKLVNHLNGIKDDNRVENLEWATASENVQHAYNTGLIKPADMTPLQKLSKVDVEFIIKNCIPRDREYGFHALSRKYNVNRSTIERVYYNGGYKNMICKIA